MTGLRENVDHERRLVWMDLETTGLDPESGVILEIGVIITDLELTEIARKAWVIPHDRTEILDKMDDYVLKMHLGSGLLEEVWGTRMGFNATQKARDNIERDIANFISKQTGYNEAKDNYLCGSSVGSFDMQWLKLHAAYVLIHLSYRVGDVSAFKVFFQDLLSGAPREAAHRALPDLDHSMDLLRQMRDRLGLIQGGKQLIENAEAAQQKILDAAAGL